MRATYVENFMVLANYWEEARPHPFPPRNGVRAGIVLISPAGEETIHSFHLEFECTNNLLEYEALLLGLELARDMKIKCLSAIGDSDLVVS